MVFVMTSEKVSQSTESGLKGDQSSYFSFLIVFIRIPSRPD